MPIGGSTIPIAARQCSSPAHLTPSAARPSPSAAGNGHRRRSNLRWRLANSHRRLTNGHRRRSKIHGRAAMAVRTTPNSFGVSPISMATARIPLGGRRWRSAKRQNVAATLRNAEPRGHGLCRDGNAFREAGKLVAARSNGHPRRANEVFRDGKLLGKAPKAMAVTAMGIEARRHLRASLPVCRSRDNPAESWGVPPEERTGETWILAAGSGSKLLGAAQDFLGRRQGSWNRSKILRTDLSFLDRP